MAARNSADSHALFTRLMNERDAEGLMELYTEDAVYVATQGQRLHGHDQILPVLAGMVAGDSPLPRMELIDVIELADFALERSIWTLDYVDPDGKPAQQSGHSTVVLRPQADSCWRIAIDDPGLGQAL